MGFALRNIPIIDVAEDIDPIWSSALRPALADLSMRLSKLVESHGP